MLSVDGLLLVGVPDFTNLNPFASWRLIKSTWVVPVCVPLDNKENFASAAVVSILASINALPAVFANGVSCNIATLIVPAVMVLFACILPLLPIIVVEPSVCNLPCNVTIGPLNVVLALIVLE